MSVTVTEMKDDALLDIKVNKSYYFMVKATSFYLFSNMPEGDKETMLKEVTEKKYEDLNEWQRSFYTVALLLAEIEKQAKDNNAYVEKVIPQPGDPDYIESK
jgi:hypothetical protein